MRNRSTKTEVASKYAAGMSTSALAEEYGRGKETILRWLKECGIRPRPAGHFRKGMKPQNARDWTAIDRAIREKYGEKGRFLASELGLSVPSLHMRASKLGIRANTRPLPSAQKEKISASLKGRTKGHAWRERLSLALSGRPHSDDRLLAIAQGVSKSRKAPRGMTKPESSVWKVMGHVFGPHNPYRYSGDRSLWLPFLDGKLKNPDFCSEQMRKVVEVYGTYWHRHDNPDDLVTKYREIGWDCLVIWENDIMLRDRILYFTYPEEEENEEWDFTQKYEWWDIA